MQGGRRAVMAAAAMAAVVLVTLTVVATRRETGPVSLAATGGGTSTATDASLNMQSSHITVDAVDVDLTTPILPGGALASTTPGQTYQVTSSVSYAPPYAAVEFGAIPYGSHNPALSAQLAQPGSAPAFRKEIADARARAGQVFARALPITLFGKQVEGQVTQTTEPVAGVQTTRLHAEWVTEAGNRVWILRITVDDLTEAARDSLVNKLGGLSLASATLSVPTTIDQSPAAPPAAPFRGSDNSFSLDLPPWWDAKDCDGGRNAAHEILATWNGLEACGPNVDMMSTIYAPPGVPRWGAQLEWECVELSKRYLWQRYGISDQPADGFNTVDATIRVAPMLVRYSPDGVHVPQAGDVMSFGTVSPGHTSVVTAASVDAQGDGTYTTINENVGRQAIITFDIVHWLPTTTHLGRGTGIPPVNDWLHDPNNTPGLLGPGGLGTPGTGLATAPPAPVASDFIATPDGNEYRIAGGAPLRVFSCTGLPSGCAAPQKVADLRSLRPFPANGTALTAGGSLHRVAGGAALRIGPCPATDGCAAAIAVDPLAIARLDHLRAYPADGTVLLGMPSARYWVIRGGQRSPTNATPSAIAVSDGAIASLALATATPTPAVSPGAGSTPTPTSRPTPAPT